MTLNLANIEVQQCKECAEVAVTCHTCYRPATVRVFMSYGIYAYCPTHFRVYESDKNLIRWEKI